MTDPGSEEELAPVQQHQLSSPRQPRPTCGGPEIPFYNCKTDPFGFKTAVDQTGDWNPAQHVQPIYFFDKPVLQVQPIYNTSTLCAVHGKQRRMRYMESDGEGRYKCLKGFQCLVGGAAPPEVPLRANLPAGTARPPGASGQHTSTRTTPAGAELRSQRSHSDTDTLLIDTNTIHYGKQGS